MTAWNDRKRICCVLRGPGGGMTLPAHLTATPSCLTCLPNPSGRGHHDTLATQHAPSEEPSAACPRLSAAGCGLGSAVPGIDSEAGSEVTGRTTASASSLLRRQPFLAAGFRQFLHAPQRWRRGFGFPPGAVFALLAAPALGAAAAKIDERQPLGGNNAHRKHHDNLFIDQLRRDSSGAAATGLQC